MNLLIVDDDMLIRKSLKISLSREPDITVIAVAADGAEAVDICKNTRGDLARQSASCQGLQPACTGSTAQTELPAPPDIILMDINMPGMDGIAATRLIKSRYPDIKIMMLTTFDDRPNIQQALAAGADGYLIKTDKISGIAGKLRLLLDGTGVVDTNVLKKLAPKENPALETLTPRERDIARLIAQGLPNKEIATNLFLSEGTVRNNIVVIMEKLGVTNRTQLGIAYYK